MPPEHDVVFISLLERFEDAQSLARLIDSLRTDRRSSAGGCVVPDIRGGRYFSAAGAGHRGRVGSEPARADSVYLLMNDAALAATVADVAGVFVVGVAMGSPHDVDPRWHLVRTTTEEAPLALAETAMRIFTPTITPGAGVFDPRAAALLTSVRAARAVQGAHPPPFPGLDGRAPARRAAPRVRPSLPPLLETVEAPARPALDPFDLLIDASARRSPHTGSPAQPAAGPQVRRSQLPRRSMRSPARSGADSELAAQMARRAPTIVVVGSRKGGVGKTSHAAGVAIVAGTVLDSVGHRAAIVDANVANPDAWGYFDLPAEATTVRSLAAALAAGRPAPRPVNARSPGLACYPETRDGAEYSRTDVRRLAAHLRERYAFVVVDMSNRLPDPTAGPEAAAAAFWLAEADALVLPTACSRQDFNAVLDFLDVAGLPPVVVPCIVPTTRRNRRHPVTQTYLAEIGDRVDALVEIPDESERIRRAGMDGVAVEDVSGAMRSAYRRLARAITDLPPRRRP